MASESADHALRSRADVGMMSEGFTLENIGQVNLYDRAGALQQRIHDGDRGVGIGRRIDNDTQRIAPGLLDPSDDFTLVVALAEIQGETELCGTFPARRLDFGQGLAAVNLWFTAPQHVQIRPVEDEDLI